MTEKDLKNEQFCLAAIELLQEKLKVDLETILKMITKRVKQNINALVYYHKNKG